MAKYEITISRGILTVHTKTVIIEADNLKIAEKKGLRKVKLSSHDNGWRDDTWTDNSKYNYQIEESKKV